MAYGICRIQKLKAGNLKPSIGHTLRKRFTPNANPEKEHICIIGEEKEELKNLVRNRIGKQPIRKNAVLAVEMLLSASPEYFRPDDKSEAGYYEPSRLEAFQAATTQWLSTTYGDRIVQAHLHLDEVTPHIHAYLVPLDDRGKLNCRRLFGTRSKLSQLQDSFARAMSQIGLERGIKGSKATHTQIQKYYTAVTQAPNLTLDAADIQHQLADRKRILKENTELKRTVTALSRQLEVKDKRSVELEVGREALIEQVHHLQQKYQSLINSTDKPSLQEVVHELGLSPVEGKTGQWRNHEHLFQITETSFSPFSEASEFNSSNSVLDLVSLVNNCSFTEAVVWLHEHYGEAVTAQTVDYHVREIVKTNPAAEFTPPVSDQNRWQDLRFYLLEQLQLPSGLVDKLHKEGLIYADKHKNLVSLCRSLTGSTITGATLSSTTQADNQFTSFAPNSKRSQGWFYFESGSDVNQTLRQVVLVDSPLDALAMATLNSLEQKTMYLSLSQSSPPWEFLRSQPKQSVVIALNNQTSSQVVAQQIKQHLPKQTVFKSPSSANWVTDLEKAHLQKQQPEYTQSRGLKR